MKRLLLVILAFALVQVIIFYDNKVEEKGDPRDSLSEEEYNLYYNDHLSRFNDSIYQAADEETETKHSNTEKDEKKKRRKFSAYEIGFEAGYNDGHEDGTMELGDGYSYNDGNPYDDEEYRRVYRDGYRKGHNEGFYEYEYGDEDDYDEY